MTQAKGTVAVRSSTARTGAPNALPRIVQQELFAFTDAGELVQVGAVPAQVHRRPSTSIGRFVRMSQLGSESLMRDRNMTLHAYRVLHAILARVEYGNVWNQPQAVLVEATGLHRNRVTDAMKVLVEGGYLLERKSRQRGKVKFYLLNPEAFAMGKDTTNRRLQEQVRKEGLALLK